MMELTDIHPNARRANESFADYRARLWDEKDNEKLRKRGTMIWPAKNGTYREPRRSVALGSTRKQIRERKHQMVGR
jgi:hypothetical protein